MVVNLFNGLSAVILFAFFRQAYTYGHVLLPVYFLQLPGEEVSPEG